MTLDSEDFLNKEFRRLFFFAKELNRLEARTLESLEEPYDFEIYKAKASLFLESMEEGRYLEALRIANYFERTFYLNTAIDNPSEAVFAGVSVVHSNFEHLKRVLEKTLEPTLKEFGPRCFSIYYKKRGRVNHLQNLATAIDITGGYHSVGFLVLPNSITLISDPLSKKGVYATVKHASNSDSYQISLMQQPSRELSQEILSQYLLGETKR